MNKYQIAALIAVSTGTTDLTTEDKFFDADLIESNARVANAAIKTVAHMLAQAVKSTCIADAPQYLMHAFSYIENYPQTVKNVAHSVRDLEHDTATDIIASALNSLIRLVPESPMDLQGNKEKLAYIELLVAACRVIADPNGMYFHATTLMFAALENLVGAEGN